jgi:hypothetical protein
MPPSKLEFSSKCGLLEPLLETQEGQDRFLTENSADINAKIRRGIEQLDRGEGVREDQLMAHLAKLKRSRSKSSRSCTAGGM